MTLMPETMLPLYFLSLSLSTTTIMGRMPTTALMPGRHQERGGGGGGKENGGVNALISPTPTQQSAIQKGGGSDGNKEEVDVVCWRMMAESALTKRRR
jgi:hypothetical protein